MNAEDRIEELVRQNEMLLDKLTEQGNWITYWMRRGLITNQDLLEAIRECKEIYMSKPLEKQE